MTKTPGFKEDVNDPRSTRHGDKGLANVGLLHRLATPFKDMVLL